MGSLFSHYMKKHKHSTLIEDRSFFFLLKQRGTALLNFIKQEKKRVTYKGMYKEDWTYTNVVIINEQFSIFFLQCFFFILIINPNSSCNLNLCIPVFIFFERKWVFRVSPSCLILKQELINILYNVFS
jgi:hypothetical protein